MGMFTIQIRLTRKQIEDVDFIVKNGHYPNRSEAIRDAVRKLINSSSAVSF